MGYLQHGAPCCEHGVSYQNLVLLRETRWELVQIGPVWAGKEGNTLVTSAAFKSKDRTAAHLHKQERLGLMLTGLKSSHAASSPQAGRFLLLETTLATLARTLTILEKY